MLDRLRDIQVKRLGATRNPRGVPRSMLVGERPSHCGTDFSSEDRALYHAKEVIANQFAGR
jgi:hypothetical protein